MGSAAATTNNWRLVSGSEASCWARSPSAEPATGPASGFPKPPASCWGVSRRDTSRIASALPSASARIRSLTCSSSGERSDDVSSTRASPSDRPRR